MSANTMALIASWAVPTLMVLAMWIERRTTQNKQHADNIKWQATIETMVKPMWDWWITNGKH